MKKKIAEQPPPGFLVGIDLGQAQDPTALAVAGVLKPDIHIRHLERLPLGTPYPQVIERITALVEKLPGATLVVDATGVGRAVLDQLREVVLNPIAVTITGGQHTRVDGLHWRVPKQALLRPLVAATESGRLKVAKGLRDAEAFQRELRAFQRRITQHGHSAFEGVGAHDDLVIAAALVCWCAERRGPGQKKSPAVRATGLELRTIEAASLLLGRLLVMRPSSPGLNRKAPSVLPQGRPSIRRSLRV